MQSSTTSFSMSPERFALMSASPDCNATAQDNAAMSQPKMQLAKTDTTAAFDEGAVLLERPLHLHGQHRAQAPQARLQRRRITSSHVQSSAACPARTWAGAWLWVHHRMMLMAMPMSTPNMAAKMTPTHG
mmetsp:Transcript_21008/g.59337  ORF Transcript_21008/g.59337 Transcript_21008/m.59337 type:complete len:130 (-) Transcript_21008:81-470(-)